MKELQDRAKTILPREMIMIGRIQEAAGPAETDEVLLLVDRHGCHGVARVGVVRQHVENTAAVHQQP